MGRTQAGTGRIYDAKIPLPYLELKCCGMSLAATFYARRSTLPVLRLPVAHCPLPNARCPVPVDAPCPSLCPTAVSYILPNTFLVVAFAKILTKSAKSTATAPSGAELGTRHAAHGALFIPCDHSKAVEVIFTL